MAIQFEQVQQLYIALWGRPADPGGLSYWGNILATDPTAIPTIAETFKNSQEYAALYGGKPNAAIVDTMYQHLFGHSPSGAQLAEASAMLDAGTTIGNVITGIINSAAAADATVLGLKVNAATALTASLDTPTEQIAFATDAGRATARQYLAHVDDGQSLYATTTPFALSLVTNDIIALRPWSRPALVDEQVQELYVAYFSRAAEPGGHAYWAELLDGDPNNANLMVIGGSFAGSQEYLSEYDQPTNELLIANVYQNLFGRAAESSGVEYWAEQINAGIVTIDNIVRLIANGAQGSDEYALDAKVDVAQAITAAINTPAEVQAYQGESANAAVSNYIASVIDVASFEAAIAPAMIDALIAGLGPGAVAPPMPGVDGNIELVGIAAAEPVAGLFA